MNGADAMMRCAMRRGGSCRPLFSRCNYRDYFFRADPKRTGYVCFLIPENASEKYHSILVPTYKDLLLSVEPFE